MFKRTIRGFVFAFAGLRIAWRQETSFKLQILIGIATLLLAAYVQLGIIEFLIIVLTIAAVLAVECLNTAIEELCDMYRAIPDPHIEKIKDLAAAASLMICSGAFVIGLLVFYPHLANLL